MAADFDEKEKTPSSSGDSYSQASPPSPTPHDVEKHDVQVNRNSVVSVGEDKNKDPLAHLPEHERAILKEQLDMPTVKIGIKTLYRYATRKDLIIMAVSAIMAIAGGAAMPLMTVVFGTLTGTFANFFLGLIDHDEFNHQLGHYTLYFVYIAIGEFVTIYICSVGFLYTGEHIAQKTREAYLRAILRQNVGFFDKLGAGEITTRITSDTNLIQDGISHKVGLTLTALATFITAFVIAYIKYWKLALILTSTIFAIVVSMGLCSKFLIKWSKKSIDSYGLGGTVAEEVLSSIRNATAFNTQDKLAKQYDEHLSVAELWGSRMKSLLGVMLGTMMLIMWMNYGLAFWMGSRFLVDGSIGVSQILTTLLAIIIGAFSIGNVAPNIQAFTTALSAAGKIYSTIDRASPLDPSNDVGEKLEHVKGDVELKNVKQIYPSRPEVVVMEDVSLFVPAGKTTALVGASGSGKSTIVGLVERFYDPVGGALFLDGVDIRKLNLRFLRQQVSLVGQEPTLFSTTIFGNIAHGLIGTKYESVEDEQKKDLIIDAAKQANAHDFISDLPEGYDTNVGERGFLLSGGQKQRIAIARAIVSDPKILLLDEATSALDTKSEGVVQAALDKAAQGRTTIVIAHRLSTIRDADNIVVMQEGKIVEQGTHDDLLERQGAYFNLVEAQKIAAEQNEAPMDPVEEYEKQVEIIEPEKALTRTRTKESIKITRTTTSKSVSSAVLEGQPAEKKPKHSLWSLIKLVASFNKKEWPLMILGMFASILAGGAQPTQSVFFAHAIVALSRPPTEYAELRSDINFWCWMYFMLAVVVFLSYSTQGICFAIASERLIHRARNAAFRAMLRQEIGFFDKDENSAGALTSFLSTQTTHLAGLSGATLGTILNVLTTLISAFVLSLAIGWKLALVCIATVPILLSCGFLRFWLLARFQTQAKAAYEKSASYACEAVTGSAIRTVASLTREGDVWDNYHEQLVEQGRSSFRSNLKSSGLYAMSQSFMFLCIALGFWYGGTLLANREYTEIQFFICFSSVIFGAQSAGTIFSFAPDMGKAKSAAAEMKTLFDRKPAIDSWSTEGAVLEHVEGAVEFRDVHFRYPTRPEQRVLRGLSFTVKPGQYVALVGASGCGKSTTIASLERFYDPLSGSILIDGVDISTLNIMHYRSLLALVSQEPTLYQGTIRENILLGADHPADIDEAEIEQACKDANIYNFIVSLPDGFSTVVGNKGVMLSGGQKQRVAIARALLRKPKVLLLDEATSALDSESEKIVQNALDKASKGRTTIAIAHRLSTIQKADKILVVDGGRVVEAGTHQELMARRGRYSELVGLQSLERHAA